MSDTAQLAKTARQLLASALNAIQSSSNAPTELGPIAETIAEAMGILHRIERSNGASTEGSDVAVGHIRTILQRLQQLNSSHPTVEKVLEAVAASLGKVHQLARQSARPQPVQAQPAQQPAPYVAPVRTQPIANEARPQQPAAKDPSPVYASANYPQPVAQQPHPVPAQQPVAAQPNFANRTALLQPQPTAPQQPAFQQQQRAEPVQKHAPAPQQQRSQPAHQPPPQAAPAARPSGSINIDVELGTHSPSNFYKGLGGNNVVDHGGIFVATYKIPKLGSSVALRVLLPGDYEFRADAVVQWTRDQGGTGESSEPGFGARFINITNEARQLIYRYTRNREPLFYDDL